MSTVEANTEVTSDPVPEVNDLELTAARDARVGSMRVRRLLPLRLRRSVGPWCFVDHYGPTDVDGVAGMNVPPHPHIGLQTVTWLLAGDVLHRDSLGSEQLIRPGQLNLMTAGQGIAHAEESPPGHDPTLHGVQLWIALRDATRHVEPAFEHHATLPQAGLGGFVITVLMGELAGAPSPATAFSPVVGAELTAAGRAASCLLPLRPDFEHVVFVAAGQASVDGVELAVGQLLYLPTGRPEATLSAPEGSTVMLLGGEPLGERLLMWWNFVARTPEDIVAATAAWQAGEFGPVGGYQGDPLPAPPLNAARLRPPQLRERGRYHSRPLVCAPSGAPPSAAVRHLRRSPHVSL